MHEYSIVQALYESVMTHVITRGEGTIQQVRVRIGDLSGVDSGLLQTAWHTFRVRTPCAHAEMLIETVPPVWQCPACSQPAPPRGPRRCAACGGPLQLAEGDEILLEQIVMEVP